MVVDHMSSWAAPYGMPSATVDGNDVEQVSAVALEAVDSIRSTGRPFLLETYTYRLRGHFEPDDQAYVDPQELTTWRGRDPLLRMKTRLLESGRMNAKALEVMETAARRRIDEAVDFATDSPFPELAELVTDVYA
jgi:pyruvate dehydrogenase E1 component alpha subunit